MTREDHADAVRTIASLQTQLQCSEPTIATGVIWLIRIAKELNRIADILELILHRGI
jgi:hypothetical protein